VTASALAEDLARAIDPVTIGRAIGMTPDDWQVGVLRSTATRILLNVCRQGGKTLLLAIIAIWTALYAPGALVLVVSASERQARELFRTAIVAYRVLGRPVPAEAENRLSLELENGSRVVVIPATAGTVRGYASVAALILDEAAQVPDELYATVRPMLAVSGGRIIAASTPFGRRGWWFEAWRSDERWERVEVRASQCPRIPAEFLAEERRVLGQLFYEQEYECTFGDLRSQAFRQGDVDAMFDEEVTAWAV
jgi:hypothetical protein